nr:transposase [Planococcus faecalis]
MDDFAFKKRFTYGTIFIDLQTHKPVSLLNTRQPEEVTKWLKNYPAIELITRDGSKTYAAAVTDASSAILQVADRWHLLHQLFEAIKKTIVHLLPAKWTPSSPKESVVPEKKADLPLRKSEVQRMQNEEKRWKRIQQVQSLFQKGYSVTAMARKLHLSPGTIYADLGQTEKPNHQRASPYNRFRFLIRSLIQEEQNVKQIEEACRAEGYHGSLGTLTNLVAEERREVRQNKPATISVRQKVIHIIWDFEKGYHRERLHELHPALLKTFPQLLKLDELVRSFRNLFREKNGDHLLDWIGLYKQSDLSFVQSFIKGLLQDLSAAQLSIEMACSNGPTEGQVNRLKTIKRMMYGRAGFQVLRNRVLYQWSLS